MYVDTAVVRQIEDLFGQDLAVCRDHDTLRVDLLDDIKRLTVTQGLRLINGQSVLKRAYLHLGRCHHHFSAAGLIGLGEHRRDLVSRFDQAFQTGYGEIGCTHEYDLHSSSSLISRSSSSVNIRSTFDLKMMPSR